MNQESKKLKINSQVELERDAADARLQELATSLTERVKELNCLYGISRLFEDEDLSMAELFQRTINFIPPAWQYPEITCARIKLKNKAYTTPDFQETAWSQKQDILVNGKHFGTLEVYYKEERPQRDEGPFLKEERNLLYVIAERLGHAVMRLITENNAKILYRREKDSREKLQSEMKVRVDFTRKLIHELKTPLTSLIATSQLLYDEIKDDRCGKLARYIWESASNLNNRVDELQDVVRGEIGILKLALKRVNIHNLLQSLVEETRAVCSQQGISIDLKIDENIPEIMADPDRIRQVLLNLINNALKYAGEGPKISISALRKAGMVQIEVRDYGKGVPEDRREKIFKPGYQQLNPDERAGGLGLGLTLCKTLVELHGGRIWLKSHGGRGSSFIFTIPIKELSLEVS